MYSFYSLLFTTFNILFIVYNKPVGSVNIIENLSNQRVMFCIIFSKITIWSKKPCLLHFILDTMFYSFSLLFCSCHSKITDL